MSHTPRPVLLTGVRGQVGGELLPMLQSLGEVLAPSRHELNLSDSAAVRRYIRAANPRWIINPAAYTAVDKAEGEPELAFAINAEAPGALGAEAAAMGIPVIHFSTDYVFSGEGTEPWKEEDSTGPLGVYGASKLEGERRLAASGAAHFIFRTSWVYGSTGNNFLRTILRLAREREEMKIVADQHGAPTWSRELARLTAHTMAQVEAASEQQNIPLVQAAASLSGVYHAAGAGCTTWFGFAKEFVARAELAEPEQRFARLLPITTAEYPTPARRPGNSRLNCEKLKAQLGFAMPAWQESVAAVMSEVTGR